MKLTIAIKSKSRLITDDLIKSFLLDMMIKGEPMPVDVANSLRKTGKATYQTLFAVAEYELS